MRKWLSNLLILAMLFSLLMPVPNANAASSKATLEELTAQLEAAKADTAEKKSAMDLAYEASEEATQKEAQGTAAFFDYCGCSAASDILKTDWAKEYTEIGAAKDTTSLSNLKAAIPFIKECNTLRLQEGTDPESGNTLGVLKVSLMLMAISEVQGNWSANQFSHCGQYNVAENLAWGYSDPFDGWYTEEKAEWDGGNQTYSDVGHYLNMCSADYTVTGFAVNQKSSYRVAHEQSFLWYGYSSSDIVMTVDEFESKVNEYVNSIEDAKNAYTEAKAAYDDALAYEKELEEQIANYNCTEHKPVTDEAIAATCTEDGLTEGSHCSECGEVLVAQNVVPALGHNIVTDEAVAATCTKDGKTEGSHCDRCSDVFVAQNVVPALGHNIVTDEAVAATCTKDGKTEGSHCDRCSEVFVTQNVVPALGHNIVTDEAVVATCTEDGKTEGSHCDRCEKILSAQKVIPALGHLVVGEGGKEPTCTENGLSAAGHCERCDKTLEEPTIIPALGHKIITDEAVAATCTEDGKTEGSHCDRCNEVLVAQTVIPALGHSIITDEAVAATCTEDGLTEGSHCDRCNEVLVPQTEITATGHSYETTIIPATTTKDGSIIKKCSACEDEITKSVAAIKSVTITPTTLVYNGTAQKVTVVCKDRTGKTISNKFYKVGYLNNKYVGTSTVVVKFNTYYEGKITKTFKIIPPGTKFTKLASGSKSFTVTWEKQPTFTSGYILQYSTDPGFAAGKTKTLVISKYATKQTIKNLRGNQKYYVRIRVYKTMTTNGKKVNYYSTWSPKKYIITKR
ncbi:MAG: hypothetical protein ACI4F4_01865 [Lachnospiraceae bacterium]